LRAQRASIPLYSPLLFAFLFVLFLFFLSSSSLLFASLQETSKAVGERWWGVSGYFGAI
jgi:hypothetical protein